MIEWEDVQVGAATMVLEAAGEGDLGMELVAWVLRNRCARPGWPSRVAEVAFDDWDFSCWNSDSKRRGAALVDRSPLFWQAVAIFIRVWHADREDDPTDGADHYYNPSLASPSWAPKMRETFRFKKHVFLDSRRSS